MPPTPDAETRRWLEADLSGELPEYDWGPEGIPEGLPVVYDPEQGKWPHAQPVEKGWSKALSP
ncbi:MAG: hypothetical protein AAFZ80_05200 [Cyanobacteria bacterium P01_A01_bin.105]